MFDLGTASLDDLLELLAFHRFTDCLEDDFSAVSFGELALGLLDRSEQFDTRVLVDEAFQVAELCRLVGRPCNLANGFPGLSFAKLRDEMPLLERVRDVCWHRKHSVTELPGSVASEVLSHAFPHELGIESVTADVHATKGDDVLLAADATVSATTDRHDSEVRCTTAKVADEHQLLLVAWEHLFKHEGCRDRLILQLDFLETCLLGGRQQAVFCQLVDLGVFREYHRSSEDNVGAFLAELPLATMFDIPDDDAGEVVSLIGLSTDVGSRVTPAWEQCLHGAHETP